MTGLDPLALRERIKSLLLLHGEEFQPLPAGSPARRGVFSLLPRGSAATFVPDANVAGLTRPILAARVPYDDPTPVAASLVWRGRTVKVEAAVDLRLMGTAVARMLVAA